MSTKWMDHPKGENNLHSTQSGWITQRVNNLQSPQNGRITKVRIITKSTKQTAYSHGEDIHQLHRLDGSRTGWKYSYSAKQTNKKRVHKYTGNNQFEIDGYQTVKTVYKNYNDGYLLKFLLFKEDGYLCKFQTIRYSKHKIVR